ncbi:FAD/NAD(P)-binding domain-containing protein [Cryphonectria parasitica EP155]|uniref:FAD/NAD(P)-binding domain-containing protein n=1 Tax=Cryphonectria parasitica (strain ATCC 38755 / EP155) TaxID=660469 RepID=A0A9P5CTW3_CRYP1|nr:FAD/NAD(P)-binding domain-containing protein [Cryphonectria parasitica EP155]KAF3770763.1 FAD/NAD(P)-binding domain-containing protein [Cryphonectria parasitica EP155]
MGSLDARSFDVKRVAVIGAGPCGLSAAKYLVAQQAFESIVVYEQNPEVGGVWMYSRKPSESLHVPQTSPFCPPDPPVVSPGDDSTAPVFASPMYELLNTNIPWTLMKYGDRDFPEGSLIFPTRQGVQDYLVGYAQDVRHLIRFSTTVKAVKLRRQGARDRWDIQTENLLDGKSHEETFDAIVVASGHYSTTFIPEVKNIRDFHAAHPGVLSHAKTYRIPEPFTDKKVLIVGNAASGLDIASQISRQCRPPLLLSVHEPTPEENLAHVGAEEVPAIEEFLVAEKGVRFTDGRVEKDLDAVLYCTGYLFTFPFLESMSPGLVSDGRRVYGLYKHLFHIDHPTLAFPGLPIKVVPFPISETQAAVFARVWSNTLPLPSVEEMSQWEEEEAQRRGNAFHVFPKGGDGVYLDEFHEWAMKSTGGKGKEPPVWTDEQKWQRATYAEAKLKFEMTGRKAKSLQELGFEYQPPSEVDDGHVDIV